MHKRVAIDALERHHVDARGSRVPTVMPLARVALDLRVVRRRCDGAVIKVDIAVAAPTHAALLLNPTLPVATRGSTPRP